MKCLVLVGGGHAHLFVLRALASIKLSRIKIVLISPNSHQNYSGMLPGWMAGHYNKLQFQINLQPLAQKANIQLINNKIIGFDANQCLVYLPENNQIKYDFLSIDIGCENDLSKLKSLKDKLLPIRPIDRFIKIWPQILAKKQNKHDYHLVVVGGGAAGVEIALAARYAFKRSNKYDSGYVDLVASEAGLLTEFSTKVQGYIKKMLYEADVTVHYLKAKGIKEQLVLSSGEILSADCIIAATGANAPIWLQETKLELNREGFIAIDEFQRSLSHHNVFAAGDISSRQDSAVLKSGVHAVRAGPVLLSNLIAALNNKKLRTYQPRKNSLYILSCGSKQAIASWGKWSIQGKFVWYLKSWIDIRFVKQFTNNF